MERQQSIATASLKGAVGVAFFERAGDQTVAVKTDGKGFARFAAGRFEHREMEMRPGGVAGIAGASNEIPSFDMFANLDAVAGFLEVDIVAKRAVVMADEDVIGIPLIFLAGAAF